MIVAAFIESIGWAAAVCLILGIALVIVEMFTPGFTVPGVVGFILIMVRDNYYGQLIP